MAYQTDVILMTLSHFQGHSINYCILTCSWKPTTRCFVKFCTTKHVLHSYLPSW